MDNHLLFSKKRGQRRVSKQVIVFTLAMLLIPLTNTWTANAATNTLTINQQQKINLSGRVIDGTGAPIYGASVIEKGTTNGTSTDQSGRYTLNVQSESSIIVFSFLGYSSKEFVVGAQTTINTELIEDATSFDEVVVIGYGTTTKKEVTGSVSSLSSEGFKKGSIGNPLQLLQGQVAGLVITPSNGADPNGGFQVQLRGLTTLSGGASPLIVIDGVVGGNLANISPDDIETIDVLKDGSAAAIYGTRGTNGVILVTTKRAKPGKPIVEFAAYVAMQTPDKKPDVLSGD